MNKAEVTGYDYINFLIRTMMRAAAERRIHPGSHPVRQLVFRPREPEVYQVARLETADPPEE